MATFSKVILSGGTTGKNIKVAATASAGTLIHTSTSGTTNLDEIFLAAVNSSSSSIKLTLQWGGTTSPDDDIEQTIPGESGLFWIVQGLLLDNGLIVRAFAGTANVICINGYVNRIAP